MLMPCGMKILYDKLSDLEKQSGSDFDLLFHLGEIWVQFRCQILPTLQVRTYYHTSTYH